MEVPGTGIDEPIVQASPDSPNACFHRGVFGEGLYGTPYIDSECSIGSSLFMIYGHHMLSSNLSRYHRSPGLVPAISKRRYRE